jgi:hypothetical protein
MEAGFPFLRKGRVHEKEICKVEKLPEGIFSLLHVRSHLRLDGFRIRDSRSSVGCSSAGFGLSPDLKFHALAVGKFIITSLTVSFPFFTGCEHLNEIGERHEFHRVCEGVQSVWVRNGGVGATNRGPTGGPEGREEEGSNGCGPTCTGTFHFNASYLSKGKVTRRKG